MLFMLLNNLPGVLERVSFHSCFSDDRTLFVLWLVLVASANCDTQYDAHSFELIQVELNL